MNAEEIKGLFLQCAELFQAVLHMNRPYQSETHERNMELSVKDFRNRVQGIEIKTMAESLPLLIEYFKKQTDPDKSRSSNLAKALEEITKPNDEDTGLPNTVPA